MLSCNVTLRSMVVIPFDGMGCVSLYPCHYSDVDGAVKSEDLMSIESCSSCQQM